MRSFEIPTGMQVRLDQARVKSTDAKNSVGEFFGRNVKPFVQNHSTFAQIGTNVAGFYIGTRITTFFENILEKKIRFMEPSETKNFIRILTGTVILGSLSNGVNTVYCHLTETPVTKTAIALLTAGSFIYSLSYGKDLPSKSESTSSSDKTPSTKSISELGTSTKKLDDLNNKTAE